MTFQPFAAVAALAATLAVPAEPILVVKIFWEADSSPPPRSSQKLDATGRCGEKLRGYVTSDPLLERDSFNFLAAFVTSWKPRWGEPEVFRVAVPLTERGRRTLEEWSQLNVGRRVAIFLDGHLISAPRIMEKFAGPLPLEGCYSRKEAERLANRLKRAG